MGQAIITENLGEGLYRARLRYDIELLNAEIGRLTAEQAKYWTLVLNALRTVEQCRQAKSDARAGMEEIIAQWKDALISKLNEAPPEIPPDDPMDPGTGEPWIDPDRAQDGPLLEAINAARATASVAAVTRHADLDRSLLIHLRNLAATGSTQALGLSGSTSETRAASAGYVYDPDVGVGLLLGFGTRTVAATVAKWNAAPSQNAVLMDEGYTECGVAYVYAPENPYSYLWGAVFAAPGITISTTVPPDDPAKEAAADSDAELERIPIPTVEDFSPDKLSAAAGEFAKAAQALRAAEEAVARLRAENLDRDLRLTQLTALKTASESVLTIWECQYIDDIPVGTQVDTAELPGYFDRRTESRTTTMGVRNDPSGTIPNQTLAYTEQRVNLLPTASTSTGRLRHGEVMGDAEVFVNLALEPGHFRWKPIWRYGTLTALSNNLNLCSVTLEPDVTARGNEDIRALPIDDPLLLTLTNVPISYPPCHGSVFEIGDEVLVLFEGFNRATPKVIGFRREPRPCSGRISWEQVQ